jgi:formylglycine-generating enzyme required for sulfatase activity
MTFGMGKEGKPAVGMTQYGALQYCHWLYLKTGIFYRLPTEAEWEYAARAGSKDRFFFGSDPTGLEDYAWFATNSKGSTQGVGTKKPNPWGLHDIYGNVTEWTIDQYAPDFYGKSADTNPINRATKLYPHALRGGNFASTATSLGSSFREQSSHMCKRIDPHITYEKKPFSPRFCKDLSPTDWRSSRTLIFDPWSLCRSPKSPQVGRDWLWR